MIWGSGSFLTVCLTQRLDQVHNWYSPPPTPTIKKKLKGLNSLKVEVLFLVQAHTQNSSNVFHGHSFRLKHISLKLDVARPHDTLEDAQGDRLLTELHSIKLVPEFYPLH